MTSASWVRKRQYLADLLDAARDSVMRQQEDEELKLMENALGFIGEAHGVVYSSLKRLRTKQEVDKND